MSVLDIQMHISDLAAAKLQWLLYQEQNDASAPLAVRLIPMTSGCNTPSFALELMEVQPDHPTHIENNILFTWETNERSWIDGLHIDLDRNTGKFIIAHTSPPLLDNCPLPVQSFN